jgi:hypothetical protein
VPDLPGSSRDTVEESALPTAEAFGDPNEARAELRLRVLKSLPFLHQRFLFQEITERCSRYLRRSAVNNSEVSVEEMLSEVWKKMLSSVSVHDENVALELERLTIDPRSPEGDGRVIWLIEEIGGAEALAHRHEDILRQRYGRYIPERGRRIVQAEDDEEFEAIGVYQPPAEVEDVSRLAWSGLIKLAERKFPPNDDVSALLQLLDQTPDLFDKAGTGKWPINDIVLGLNSLFPDATWDDDRVDNAKRRLTRWTSRLMEVNGLDQSDFEALLVRVAKRIPIGGNDYRHLTKP